MKEYYLFTHSDTVSLDTLVEQEKVKIVWKAKYTDVYLIRSELTQEEITEKLPGYEILEEKTYEVSDDK